MNIGIPSVKVQASDIVVLCNGASLPERFEEVTDLKVVPLNYRDQGAEQNVKLLLPDFVRNVYYFPDRILDLLEIAAFVFCADRLIRRGRKDAVEYHSWSRKFHFVVKVRDYEFWNEQNICRKLSETLSFMSGDHDYQFDFEPGHSTPPTSLFDKPEFQLEKQSDTRIVLFSGGLDSLAGVVEILETSKAYVCLVSHRSGQPSTRKTQDQLYNALERLYPGRVKHYTFYCSLKDVRAEEETQRTRAFLYTSIAYALAHIISEKSVFVYENGITALNFLKRQDMINARASRTTHPKTMHYLQDLFSEVEGDTITINTPFLWKTKTDVLKTLFTYKQHVLISSAVSCSKTFQNLQQATHCGGCSQCVDRRFAAYAAELDDIDESGIYAFNFIHQTIEPGETKTTIIDYMRQAQNFATWNVDHFYEQLFNELVDVIEFLGMPEEKAVEALYNLCHRHGEQINCGYKRMQTVHDNPYYELPSGSLFQIIGGREHLKEPVQRLAEEISRRLARSVPLAFQNNLPKNENDFNDKVGALLTSDKNQFDREYPAISFALARSVPDHSTNNAQLLIESKYLRDSTTPSKASEAIAADLTKYPSISHILFIVFDPSRSIADDDVFKDDFERKGKGRCTVTIIR